MNGSSDTPGVYVVTGGTQGIGESIALALARAGASGMVICGRNEENGARVAAAVEDAGSPCLFAPADLADPEACRAILKACDTRFSRIDGLVNAAGMTDRGTLEDTSVELWDRLFAINTRAPFLLMQEAVRIMKREKIPGAIVNIVTMSSHGGQPFLTGYSASKGALAILTKNAAHALRADRIRVNALNIGWSDTPNEHRVQVDAMGQPGDWLEKAEAAQPFGQLIKPAEVAEMVVFLLSRRAGVMTGSVIDYDQNVMGALD